MIMKTIGYNGVHDIFRQTHLHRSLLLGEVVPQEIEAKALQQEIATGNLPVLKIAEIKQGLLNVPWLGNIGHHLKK